MKTKFVILRARKKAALLKEIKAKVNDDIGVVYLNVKPNEKILSALLLSDKNLKAVITYPSLFRLTSPKCVHLLHSKKILFKGLFLSDLNYS